MKDKHEGWVYKGACWLSQRQAVQRGKKAWYRNAVVVPDCKDFETFHCTATLRDTVKENHSTRVEYCSIIPVLYCNSVRIQCAKVGDVDIDLLVMLARD